MRKFSIYLLILIILIVFLTLTIITAIGNMPKSAFSEIYFTNPTDLPKSINVGQPIEFSFTIESNENSETEYIYFITLEYDSKTKKLDPFKIRLIPNEKKEIKKSIVINENFEIARIRIELEGKNQEIHFWIKNDS